MEEEWKNIIKQYEYIFRAKTMNSKVHSLQAA